jgi:hypothetical protein
MHKAVILSIYMNSIWLLRAFCAPFARPLNLTLKGDKETPPSKYKSREPLQLLLVLKLCQLAAVIAFKHAAIK